MSGGARVRVVGVGNELLGDDAAGLLAARRVAERAPAGVAVTEATGEGTALLDLWTGAKAVFIIDAVRSRAPAGTVRRFDAAEGPLPSRLFHYSTHTVNVADAIELARTIGALPSCVVVYGIEGARFEPGDALTPEVERAIDDVAERVAHEAGAFVEARA
jgi:hydrogenase maturation protease